MIPVGEYIEQMNRLQAAINQDGPDGPGSPQTFDQAIIVRAAGMVEMQRLQMHILLEIRELLVVQAVAYGLIPKMAEATTLYATSAEAQADEQHLEDAGDDWDAVGAAVAAEEDEAVFSPDNPPPENTPAWYAWRAEMNARGFPAVPIDMVAEGLTEADLSDPAKIKERMEQLAGTTPP